jgi:hypothetical protein
MRRSSASCSEWPMMAELMLTILDLENGMCSSACQRRALLSSLLGHISGIGGM